MSKVLPRIDGDGDKLKSESDEVSLLTQLSAELTTQFSDILAPNQRPDLLRVNADGSVLSVSCRSVQKLAWMQARLATNGFTSFWP